MTPGRHNPPANFIATLGSEPQVITAALDLLLDQGEAIAALTVLHTYVPDSPIAAAVHTLREVFQSPPPGYPDRCHLLPITAPDGSTLADIATPAETRLAFSALYQIVRKAKLEGYRVHLSIAGGRKTLAVFGMATAQLLFDQDDRLWHLFSTGDFLASRRLHPQPGDQVHLVPIPVLLWSQVSPVLTDLSQIEDPFAAVERVQRLQLSRKLEQARAYLLGALTPAERRVVALLVQEGLSDQELGERLSLSPRTVEGQLRAAYRKAADHWELPAVGRSQLIALLNLYYNLGITGNPA